MAGPPTYDAVLLLSFGGPEGPDDVLPFLRRVTAGRDVPAERLDAVARQYGLFGGISPINAANRALIVALEAELATHGRGLPVYWGNRNWHPLLTDTVRRMTDDGVRRAVAFVTSAFGSYSGCRQYLDDIDHARRTVAAEGLSPPEIDKLRTFANHPGFIEPLADNVRAVLVPDHRLVFTAHSVPCAMAANSPYLAQLRDAAALVAERVGRRDRYDLVFQSRSGPAHVPWLEPDVNDHLRVLAGEGVRGVTVAPLGFVSDHMEVVYDLDTQARATADRLGLGFERAATAGTDHRFVAMIGELIRERVDPSVPRRSLGTLGVPPDHCAADCCPAATRRPAG